MNTDGGAGGPARRKPRMMRALGGAWLGAAAIQAAGAATAAGQAVYHDPSPGEVEVRTVALPGGGTVDLYALAGGAASRPAVVFAFGYPDARYGGLRKHPQYVSWARLVASEGLVGVAYEVGDDPVAELERVVAFLRAEGPALGIDSSRFAIWSCSGNTPVALKAARSARGVPEPVALVAYYGLMPTPDGHGTEAMDSMSAAFGFALPAYEPGEEYPADLPMLVVRAGADSSAEIVGSIDRFAAYALDRNLPLTLINYPAGRHAFDVTDDTPETRAIVRETLSFLRRQLTR